MKKLRPITCPRVDVDRRQEACEVVDEAGEEIEFALEQPVSDAVQSQRPDARIEQHFPARTGRGIARLYRFEIFDQP
jgi:hypothetical protein